MHFFNFLTTGLLVASAAAYPAAPQEDGLVLRTVKAAAPAVKGAAPATAAAPLTAADKADLAFNQKFYKGEMNKLKLTPRTIKQFFGGDKLKTFTESALAGRNNVNAVRQHYSAVQDTSRMMIGTVGLKTCSCLVYVHGMTVVLGHFYPTAPGVMTGDIVDGEVMTSMNDQLARWTTAMAGMPTGGYVIHVFPTDTSGNRRFWTGEHQRVNQLGATHGVVHEHPYSYTMVEMQTELAQNSASGKGVVYASDGKVYSDGAKIYDPSG